jgi:hypothetical protein
VFRDPGSVRRDVTDHRRVLGDLRSAVEQNLGQWTPEELESFARHLALLSDELDEQARQAIVRWEATSITPTSAQVTEVHELRSVAEDMRRSSSLWMTWVHDQQSAGIAEAVEFTSTAMGSGIVGSAAFEAVKASLARLGQRSPSTSQDVPERAQVWAVARGAIVERHPEYVSAADTTLPVEPAAEEVHSDGRWVLEFVGRDGDHFTVVLGPKRRFGGWAESVRSVRRSRQ